MKKIDYSFILFCILIFGFSVSGVFAQEDYSFLDSDKKISLDFKDAGLKDILKALSIQAGVNFIASQEIEDRTVTLYLDKVSVKEAMDKLFKANKLDYEYDEKAKIILVKKEEPRIETVTRVFPLKYARVSSSPIQIEINKSLREGAGGEGAGGGISAVAAKLLSAEGSLIEDPRTNSLIITDLPNRIKIIEQTIKDLDVSVPQVMLEVEILDVSKQLVDKLGFDFGANPITLMLPGEFVHEGARLFVGSLTRRENSKIDDSGAQGSVIFGTTYGGLLDLLRQRTDTKYLARPRILTLNNETAEIKIEANELIGLEPEFAGEYNEIVTGFTTERDTTGISLRVTPQINAETGEITMFIYPRVREARPSAIKPEIPLPGQTDYQDVEERGTKTLVKVRDGETIIAGGLIHNNSTETLSKVPLLGDIPFLGALFRHKNKEKDTERELLVFITPHIIKDTGLWPAPSINAILSSREQDVPSQEARLSSIQKALDSFK
ncbi:MAG: secretin N-terminal domain-containing protein [Candidatus Omnitrophota bacterium]